MNVSEVNKRGTIERSMKLNDLLAPAFIGLIAFALDALIKGPLGIMILLYAALPGILDAIIAFGAYAGADYLLAPYIGAPKYPNEFLMALALGYIAFSIVVNHLLSPFRLHRFTFKSYFLSRYSHLKALLGLVLIVARPLAYLRHVEGFFHVERAYESALAVLAFTYVLTPFYEYVVRGRGRKASRIVLSKAEGELVDAGVEISMEELTGYNGRVIRMSVKNEEKERKQYILSIEAPDRRIPNVVRTRELSKGEEDEVFIIVRPARQVRKGPRELKIYVEDESGRVKETIPGPNEPPRTYSFYEKGLGLTKLRAFLLLIVVPLASILIPTLYLKIADLLYAAVSLVFTLAISYVIFKLFSGASAGVSKRVVPRLDELVATLSLLALILFIIGLLAKSIEILLATMIVSGLVILISAISPLLSPVELEERKPKDIVALRPLEPNYFEQDLATRARLSFDLKEIKRRFGTDSFRVFIYGDDYVAPQYKELHGEDHIDLRIIPDGYGERELIVKLGRAGVPYDDSDLLIDDQGRPAVFVIRYRAMPAGSAGVPREIQQLSMRAIAFVFSPTLLLNVLNYLGITSPVVFLSVVFGVIGALPIALYFYYKSRL